MDQEAYQVALAARSMAMELSLRMVDLLSRYPKYVL